MKLRAPAVPLIAVDPYFSVWSPADKLTDTDTCHWTGHPNTVRGTVVVDGGEYRFIGTGAAPAMRQIACDIRAMSTAYVFEAAGIELEARFLTPAMIDDLYLVSRPVSYLELTAVSKDGRDHQVSFFVDISEEFCLDKKGQKTVAAENVPLSSGRCAMRMGAAEQEVLGKSGDDLRIDWGYVYLAAENGAVTAVSEEMTFLHAEIDGPKGLIVFAYDDIYSIEYFGERLEAYWRKNGETLPRLLDRAFSEYSELKARADAFDCGLFADAVKAGGEKYAELLQLAYRQVLAGHKLVSDKNGEPLYISKECFSNGCAATVDVSYPSSPLFLLYNTELVKGMMRPIFRYAESGVWPYDFAPHDAGRYPLVNGQVYSGGTESENQMPVEECGNLLIMAAAVSVSDGDTAFADEHMPHLEKWADYLEKHGIDPENQLCTDDFAGHLAHNCNLSLKAIMALAGFGIICEIKGLKERAAHYREMSEEMARAWLKAASNGDGSFRLAFDRPGTFSMKYNMVWDVLFGTGLFDRACINSEIASYAGRICPYGLPLDNRAPYTKSDWLVWTATLADSRWVFESFAEKLWDAYNYSPSRVPMTDWYDAVTSLMVGFQHRTVQGGLFIKLLAESGKMKTDSLFAQ